MIQINFAPPRPTGFANFRGAGRGGAGQDLLFCGAGRGGAALFSRGGAGRPSLVVTISSASIVSILIFFPTKVDVLFQAVAQPFSSKSTDSFTDIFGARSYPN